VWDGMGEGWVLEEDVWVVLGGEGVRSIWGSGVVVICIYRKVYMSALVGVEEEEDDSNGVVWYMYLTT